ncbi:MAG: ATP-binding protein [Marinilabiliales bacterium]|nr:ATP-binding protein [Marinilabiliales bacterium]
MPGLLTTVFMNLLENACKFSSGEIIVKLIPAPGELTITFQDQGIGIPESEIRDVVKPFTRGSNAKHIVRIGYWSLPRWPVSLNYTTPTLTSTAPPEREPPFIWFLKIQLKKPDSFSNLLICIIFKR